MKEKFEEYLKDAKKGIMIIGTNSLSPILENSFEYFKNLLTVHNDLIISILYESDNENFNQSLCLDTKSSSTRHSYTSLTSHRDRVKGHNLKSGLKYRILNLFDNEEEKQKIAKRFNVYQSNLRLPINAIQKDDDVVFCQITNQLPTFSDYIKPHSKEYKKTILDYCAFYLNETKGGKYLSKPEEELIQLYDKESFPRGIFPRKAFYTTEFKRYSIWGFIFNRKGELLLHKRSKNTKDNRELWDKSIGGHVDIRDASSIATAKRELVEELFLPEDEMTKYMRADLGDIINYGEWNLKKKGEHTFKEAFDALGLSDWILFSAIDEDGEQLKLSRISERKFNFSKTDIRIRKTIFMSDVFFFIAPKDYLDDEIQMKELVKLSEKTGAASDHKLIAISELSDWIVDLEEKQKDKETFTDDLLFINTELKSMLERFSEFVKYVFNE